MSFFRWLWARLRFWSIVPALLLVFAAFWLGAVILGAVDDLPGNTYSEGYRYGQLTHYAAQGNPVFKTGELELMHGTNSSAGQVKDAKGRVVFENPGVISSSRGAYDRYRGMVGEYVVIHYRQVKVQLTKVEGDVDRRVIDITKPDPDSGPQSCGNTDDTTGGSRGDGDTVGYLVKVSDKGNFLKSYEMVMQLGNASGSFVAMSIKSSDIADCAQAMLKSGQQVKVHHTSSLVRDPLTSDTRINVLGITKLAKAP